MLPQRAVVSPAAGTTAPNTLSLSPPQKGITALHCAAQFGQLRLIAKLIDKGANTEAKNDEIPRSPPICGPVASPRVFLELPTSSSVATRSALQPPPQRPTLPARARTPPRRSSGARTPLPRPFDAPLKYRSWPNAQEIAPLHRAVLCKQLAAIKRLVEKGADANVRTMVYASPPPIC